MTKKYFLSTRPETLVSIIVNGILPDSVRSIVYIKNKELRLFETPQLAVKYSDARNTNTFILEYNLEQDSSQYVMELDNDGIPSITAKKVNQTSLKKIYVYNKTGENLVTRLLNMQVPVEINIKSDLFSEKNETKSEFTLTLEVATPSTLITYMKTGDLLASKMQTLVNTVNCVGVMGKGIAFSFKQRFPKMFDDYKKRCDKKLVNMGVPYLYEVDSNRSIINFPTKNHWKNSSYLNDIENGLIYLAKYIPIWGIKSLAIPPLGCGNGGLNWDDVRPLINKYLLPLKIPLEIYEPFIAQSEIKRKATETVTTSKQKPLISFFEPRSSTSTTNSEPQSAKKVKTTDEEKSVEYKFNNINTIQALQGTIEIGHIDLQPEGDFYWLNHIEVNSAWRRQGIGTELIRQAVKYFPTLQIPMVTAQLGYERNYKFRLNPEVAKLTDYCFDNKILNKKIHCSQPIPKASSVSITKM